MWEAITGAISGIVSPISGYLQKRAELATQEHVQQLQINDAVNQRQVQLISEGKADDAAWEMQSLKNQGWRGSYELILVSIPLVLCFIPGGAAIVDAGFQAISKTPGWFQFTFMSIFLANYGIRLWRRNQSDS